MSLHGLTFYVIISLTFTWVIDPDVKELKLRLRQVNEVFYANPLKSYEQPVVLI